MAIRRRTVIVLAAGRGSPIRAPARTSWRQPLRRRPQRARHHPRPGDRQPACTSSSSPPSRSPTWRGSSVAARDVVVLPEVGSDGAAGARHGPLDQRRRRRPAACRRLADPARRHAAGAAGDAARGGRACSTTTPWSMPSIAASAAIRSASRAELYSELVDARRRRRRAAPGRPLSGVRRRARRSRRAGRHRHRRRPGVGAAAASPRRASSAAAPQAVSGVAPGELDQALDVAVADAAVAQRRRRLHQVGEGAAEAAVGACAGSRPSARRSPRPVWLGLRRSRVKARARTTPCGVRQGSHFGS